RVGVRVWGSRGRRVARTPTASPVATRTGWPNRAATLGISRMAGGAPRRPPRSGPERWRRRDESGADRAGRDGALPVLREAQPREHGPAGGPAEVRGVRASAAARPADQVDGAEPGPGGLGLDRARAGGLLRRLVRAVQDHGAGAGRGGERPHR